MGDPAAPLTKADSGRAWIGYLLAAASLVWVFHDVSAAALWREIRQMRLGWLVLGMGLDVLSYLTQGWRWHRLLAPIGAVGPLETTKATYAGLYLNELLPLRMGELLRIHLIARKLGGAYSAVVSSVVVERFIDAIWLAMAFGVVVLLAPLPKYLVDTEEILAAIVFGGLGGFLVLALLSKRRAESGEPPSSHWLVRKLRPLGESMLRIGWSRGAVEAFLASVGFLGFQALAYYCVVRSYGIGLTFWQVIGAFLIQHVGNAVPGGPGNLGTFQLVTVLGLTAFGVAKPTAAGFSIVVFLALTIPLWVIGSICFGRSGLSVSSIRSELASWRARGAEDV
ncbi:MAG: lysylphosphatidylglycerol synthase transmembrane domain-containing protein [Bryobacterales bacterium]